MKAIICISFTLLAINIFAQVKYNKPVQEVPNVSIYDIKGNTINLKNISDKKVTFIAFWFTSCAPCFAEMHMLNSLFVRYKHDQNFNILTITLTDSAFVRPLLENRNTSDNETYNYFKSLAKLDTFRLPVYFIKNVTFKHKSFKQDKFGFTMQNERPLNEMSKYPNEVFGFTGFPTIMIFNKDGKLIYNKTGFTKTAEQLQQKLLEKLIDGTL